MNPDALASWDDPEVLANVVEDPGFEDRKAAFRQVQAFVKTIQDAGISLALGTDSGTRNVPMGWGTHHELELYVEAGLTPMQALVAATATGAQAMPPHGESDFGTLEVGKIADLILLDADPLTDIGNTLAIDRVMQRGEWVDSRRVAIDAVATFAVHYQGGVSLNDPNIRHISGLLCI